MDTLQWLLFFLGVSLIITGIVLFIRRIGNGISSQFKMVGISLKTEAASLVIVGIGAGMIWGAVELQKKGAVRSVSVENTRGDVNIIQQGRDTGFSQPEEAARAKLEVLGANWSSEAFIDAIVNGDERSLELYLRGGMDPYSNYKGASAILYGFQTDANNQVNILKLFLKHGFDPNRNLKDMRIMAACRCLPPYWDDKLTPKGYDASSNTFVGPADLWVVIKCCYYGFSAEDSELLDQLKTGGATFEVSLAFLKAYKSIYEDTEPYGQVRRKVEKLANE